MESRQQSGCVNIERQNSDRCSVEGGTNDEYLAVPLGVARGVTIPAGGYSFNDVRFRYSFRQQRASALLQYGSNDRVFSSNVRFRWE